MSDEGNEAKQQVNMDVDQAVEPEISSDAKNREETEQVKNTATEDEPKALEQSSVEPDPEEKIEPESEQPKDDAKEETSEPVPDSKELETEMSESETKTEFPSSTEEAQNEDKSEEASLEETTKVEVEKENATDMKCEETDSKETQDQDATDQVSKDSEAGLESTEKSDDVDSKEQSSSIETFSNDENKVELEEKPETMDTSQPDEKESEAKEETRTLDEEKLETDPKVEAIKTETLKEYLPAKVVLENIDVKKMQEDAIKTESNQVSFATQIMDKDLAALDEELDDLKIRSKRQQQNYEYLNGNSKKKVEKRNKGIMIKPQMINKGITCRVQPCHKGSQTDAPRLPTLVPVPVPIFMPAPMQMYQRPYPVPVPIPMPVPVPIFIPTTRNTTRGIKKFMKKMKAKLPDNVFEAQILEMAKGVSGEKEDSLDSDDSEWEDYDEETVEGAGPAPAPPKPALPTEDVENIIKAGNIVPKPLPQVTPDACPSPGPFAYRGGMHNQRPPTPKGMGGFKRRLSEEENSWQYKRMAPQRNRGNRGGGRRQTRPIVNVETNPALAALSLPPKERPDAKHHLKFTYGVNAWRHWVVGKNAELEKARAQGKYMKPFETDILKLRADELNYTLCMFVKEVRKPNGDVYASDSILYLTLGIQEYLFENGRIDNIFTDMYYEPFTSGLHEVIKNFKLPINELGYFVTRIEEEHLWESKQLGAHSPQVLLNTLIYFNAKYFMMKTLEDHTKLSFTHIMKHWKKGGTATPATKHPPVPGEKRTTLLRYYPPAHLKPTRHDDRKCFEQQELPDNPLRCPVKLYEFYLSHCPEGAKNKSDMFYLQPERSCVPDSPVWYSGQALNPFQLEKMLARILMVREVQEHMLADATAHHA